MRSNLDSLSSVVGVHGQLVEHEGTTDVELVNGVVNKLRHRLGRRLIGWSVDDLRGATSTGRIVRVLQSGSAKADDARDLWLDVQGHGANITVRIRVY